MSLTEKLRAAVRDFDLLSMPAMKVIVGVSGGADSVALLHALRELEDYAPDIFVCHFNHCLRGDESRRDADFVAELCRKNSLPFEMRCQDTEKFSKRKGLSIEHGARNLRYGFFREVCKEIGAQRIATAHTMDDRAETVFMRILRGSGNPGVSSIKPRSGNLIRPFVGISRKEVIEYLERRGEKWVEDSSNESALFTRNKVRKRIFPLLETFNPQIKRALNRLADTAGWQSSYISLQARDAFGRVFFHSRSGNLFAGSVSACRSLHRAVRSELFRTVYSKIKGGLERLEFSHLEAMDALVMSATVSGAVNLPCGMTMERGYDIFCMSRAKDSIGGHAITMKGEGTLTIPDGISDGIAARFEKTSDTSLWGGRNVGHFSLEKVVFPIEIRNFRPGDKTVPLGMKGTKKLKSVFSDRKIPLFLRKRLPVFVCRGEIIWVGGVALSDSHKAVKGKKHLRIRLDGSVPEILENCRTSPVV